MKTLTSPLYAPSRKALYALSADPITFGHINIVERVSALFDEVVFAIGNNPTKRYLFSLEERLALANASLRRFNNVRVIAFRGMLTDLALEENADVIVKGVRNNADFDYELLLHQVGLSQQAGIDTHVLFADSSLSHVSSSVVKAIQSEHGFIHDYVPLPVKAALENKMSGQTIIGVTGTIAAGKSTLCQSLVDVGNKHSIDVHHIDTDELAHRILGKNDSQLFQSLRDDLVTLLGEDILAGKEIDRKRIAKKIFQNPELRTELNKRMIGPVQLLLRKELADKRGIILIESALLTEANFLPLCNNRVILVDTDSSTRHSRMVSRNYDESSIEARNIAQFSVQQKTDAIQRQIENDHFGYCWKTSGAGSNKSERYSLLMELSELGTG